MTPLERAPIDTLSDLSAMLNQTVRIDGIGPVILERAFELWRPGQKAADTIIAAFDDLLAEARLMSDPGSP